MATTTAAEAALFVSLPQEIRDIIYSFAYSDYPDRLAVTSFKKARLRATLVPGILPGTPLSTLYKNVKCPLNSMLVCRQWYREAAEEWFRKRTIFVTDLNILLEICDKAPSGMLQQHLRTLECCYRRGHPSPYTLGRPRFPPRLPLILPSKEQKGPEPLPDFSHLAKFPNLHTIILHINSSVFETIPDKLCYRDSLAPSDFARIPELRQLVEGLLQVQTMALGSPRGDTVRENEISKANVNALGDWLWAEKWKLLRRKKRRMRGEEAGYVSRGDDYGVMSDLSFVCVDAPQMGWLDVRSWVWW